ncbi:MAG: 4-deoxy-4-formamido-L-arabinose-phosphoundecaprenol deformylase [Phycisphaerales bacterium]|nr:4-deoxy-4-formamido-L-arabinose-phosphoundecaprenol deformylase [Phycisphaerales bacterium]
MSIGLRIDVDTFRGTRDGIPKLLRILSKRDIQATWYMTLGPDNMGRHLRRMLRPSFALKMVRSGAPSLYGWDIILRGTIWPGQVISEHLATTLRKPADAGHEVGVHAWDHHRWQVGIDSLSDTELDAELARACEAFVAVYGREASTAAAPGWRCTQRVLGLHSSMSLKYRSDCRGPARAFRPRVAGHAIDQPQIPVDLPTYDEGFAGSSRSDASWNDLLLARIGDDKPHVLTIHAESEGGSKASVFEEFLDRALASGHFFEPLRDWLARHPPSGEGSIVKGTVPGREGWVGVVGGGGR